MVLKVRTSLERFINSMNRAPGPLVFCMFILPTQPDLTVRQDPCQSKPPYF